MRYLLVVGKCLISFLCPFVIAFALLAHSGIRFSTLPWTAVIDQPHQRLEHSTEPFPGLSKEQVVQH